ncbi:TIM-barrel domain-containing protein [Natrialba aegyptia]|uniref:TIM-barrel domain-containing protein n=1 Tax=Natrialba aegyptia TaxID=129789 RepID=UPI00403B14E1
MFERHRHGTNRRSVLKSTAALLAGSAVASVPVQGHHYDSKIHYEPELDEDNLMELSVQGYEILEEGVRFNLGEYDGYISLFNDDFARVSILEEDEEVYESRGIANGRGEWDTPNFSVDETANTIAIDTETITVEVAKDLFGVKFLDETGNVVNEDYLDKGTSGYEDGKPYAYKKADADESFYGFGEQPELTLDQRGKKIENWNTDQYGYGNTNDYVYTSVPFFVGLTDTGAYGLFFDNPSHSVFHMADDPNGSGESYNSQAEEDYYYFLADGGQLTYYFAYGPAISDVLERYTDLTGTTPLPPKWAIAYHQSKWEYSPEELAEVPQRYREEEIPLDAMHFDIGYMDDYRVFTIQGTHREALNTLNKEVPELKTVAVNDPGVAVDEEADIDGDGKDESYGPYLEGTENEYWTKNANGDTFYGPVWPTQDVADEPTDAVWPDFSRSEVREWWADQHNVFFDAGFDGIKNDMGEPAVFQENDKYDWTMPADNIHGTGADTMLHEEYHNMYGFDYARASRKAYDIYKPNQRPFLLNRNLYAGGQRLAAIWTGDNVSEWLHLRMSIPMQLNLGLSGMAFCGHDVGGFAGRPSPELFKRWIELGAFIPYFRNHTDTHRKSDQEIDMRNQHPWTFGEEAVEISKKYIELRYRLMPYLYNEFEESAKTGKPIQQPLVYHFQNDSDTRDITDQFMFGDNIMIAPVVEQGATSREVYLPESETWVDFWTNEVYDGDQTIIVDAPIDHLPIFVRKDSIIPMREVQQYTGEKPLTTLELRTYLDEETTYTFYEDDGETRAFEDGEYNVTHFSVSENNGGVVTFERELDVQNYDDSELSSYLLNLDLSEAPRKVQAASTKYEEVNADEVKDIPASFAYDADADAVLVHIPVDEEQDVKLFFNGGGNSGRGR